MSMMLRAGLLDSPTVRHGFFTRDGGVSTGLFASLNCGLGSSDDPEAVRENRRRAMEALGLGIDALATVHQVHSADVAVVEQPWPQAERPRVDAMVTKRKGVALGILTADCTPVLFADERAGIIGAAHAGWRGAVGGVLEATIAAMEREGASRKRIIAAIGPCIGFGSYEVGPEFPAAVPGAGSGEHALLPRLGAAQPLHVRFTGLCAVAADRCRYRLYRHDGRRYRARGRTVLFLSPHVPQRRKAVRPSALGNLPCAVERGQYHPPLCVSFPSSRCCPSLRCLWC